MIFHELGWVVVHELVDLGFAHPSWPPTRLKQVIFPFQTIYFNENLESSNCDCMHDINLTSIYYIFIITCNLGPRRCSL
jgi:hypothetical protein